MDSKNKENKIWVERLLHEIQIDQLDEALADRGLRPEEIRLLPKGRAVLIFEQQSDATACLKERDIFRHLGCTKDSCAHLMKYQPGFEEVYRGQDNLVQERLSKDIRDLFLRSHDMLTRLTEQYKIMWFYSTSHGLYLRGPAEAVKQASGYINNNVSHQPSESGPAATVTLGYHDNSVIQVNRNEPTPVIVKQTSGNVNSKTACQARENGSCTARQSLVLQPEGTMVAQLNKKCLPGNRDCGTIVVKYDFPEGVQGENHPQPGRPYTAHTFTTYIPDSKEGRTVVQLLKKAFSQKLLFVIIWLTGKDKIVMKDCVRHKTKANGGVENNGYPDLDYLAAVKNDLAAIGIK